MNLVADIHCKKNNTNLEPSGERISNMRNDPIEVRIFILYDSFSIRETSELNPQLQAQ